MPDHHNLDLLQQALDALGANQLSVNDFCRTWRSQTALLASLPPKYGQVLEDILGRLEASSAFAEESCSFSHRDLHATLTVWLEKARQQQS
jgi:hypothetical protein